MKRINPFILKLIKDRGMVEEDEIEEFLSEKPRKTYDPFLLYDMKEGVELILSVIERKGKICIYGDYDADGVTSVAILTEFLSNYDCELSYYIPSRFSEGYGLNKEALKMLKDGGNDLIITVDCGSVSYQEVEYAKEIGLKIVITDHHNISETMADCILINPKRPECRYPFKGLAGCGVAFKLAQALQRRTNLPKSAVNKLLDLVAIGTIGDLMPLLDENRTLVKYGMLNISRGERKGLKHLADLVLQDGKNVKSQDISFGIVPHINAAGRMKKAEIGVELMQSTDREIAEQLVDDLIANNKERKEVQRETLRLCEKIIEKENVDRNIYIINCPGAHEGIAGIVAGKLKEKYNRPIIILIPIEEGIFKGTGRSVEGLNLHRMLSEHEELFLRFGGHGGACGLLMEEKNLAKFRRAMEVSLAERLMENPALFDVNVEEEIGLDISDLNSDFMDGLDALEPFGMGNERPVIKVSNLVVKDFRYLGAEKAHLKFVVQDSKADSMECILFNKGKDYRDKVDEGTGLDIFGSPIWNEWNGKKNIQFVVNHMSIL